MKELKVRVGAGVSWREIGFLTEGESVCDNENINAFREREREEAVRDFFIFFLISISTVNFRNIVFFLNY